MNLSDGILIKDNHINQLAKKLGRKKAIRLALSRADDARGDGDMLIEIEVESPQEAEIAARELKEMRAPKVIMLDNMSPADVKKAAKTIKQIDKKIVIEASGGITESNIGDYLRAGADYVSTSLFVSARPCKFKLEIS
jgi:nicotinate-nucleotide pyrophosphorylase (carboxylating)